MKGWKTFTFNALTILATLLAWPQLAEYFDPQAIVVVAAAVNFVLRFFTTTPPGKAE